MTQGARVIDSTPPAMTTSAPPAWISRAAAMVACMPEPQSGLTVWPGTSTGKPARRRPIGATLRLSSPAWLAQPKITSSTSPGSSPIRSTTSRSTTAARSSGRTSFSWPPYFPIGVRTAETMTASRSSGIGPLEVRLALLQEGGHALPEVGARGTRLLDVGLELGGVLVGGALGEVDGPLGAGQGAPRGCREALGEGPALRLHGVLGNHPVDDPETLGVLRREPVGGVEHLQRPAPADGAGQHPADAADAYLVEAFANLGLGPDGGRFHE